METPIEKAEKVYNYYFSFTCHGPFAYYSARLLCINHVTELIKYTKLDTKEHKNNPFISSYWSDVLNELEQFKKLDEKVK